jgi:hypothetical protein
MFCQHCLIAPHRTVPHCTELNHALLCWYNQSEREDLSISEPAMVTSMLAKLEAYRTTEWLGPQWDTNPQSHTCDTGPTIGSNTGSCEMRPDLYVQAHNKKGCIDSYIGQSSGGNGAAAAGFALDEIVGLRAHIDQVSRTAGSSY